MKPLSLALISLLFSQMSFAQAVKSCAGDICVSDSVLVCKEKWSYNKFVCNDDASFIKGQVLEITNAGDGSVTLALNTGKTVTVHSLSFIFKSTGCETRKNKICVGDEFEHSTSGEGSGTFVSEVVGVNSGAVLSYIGGQYYIDPLDWIYGK